VGNFFRGFGAVFYKEVLHVRRDPATLFFSLVIPLLQMVVLGFGIDTNIRQINTVVLNADGRRESRELLDRLKNSDTFTSSVSLTTIAISTMPSLPERRAWASKSPSITPTACSTT